MALTKFAIAPDGALVYRSSGALVNGTVTYTTNRGMLSNKGYTIVDNRVYRNGRLQGYIGNANTSQRKKIESKAVSRSRKPSSRLKQHQTARNEFMAMKNAIEYGGYGYTVRGSWDSVTIGKRAMDNFHTGVNTYFKGRHRVELTYEETRQMNFASGLSQSVDNNVISIDEANDMWEAYINSDSDEERSELWDELNKKNDEMGFEIDSPPLYDEMARDLGIDYTLRRGVYHGWE